jgi:hypothetical protein
VLALPGIELQCYPRKLQFGRFFPVKMVGATVVAQHKTNQTHFIRQNTWLMVPPIIVKPIESIDLSAP